MGLFWSVTITPYAGSILRAKSDKIRCLIVFFLVKSSNFATGSALTPTTWALAASNCARLASKPLISSVQAAPNASTNV